MRVEFAPTKDRTNRRKHGISLAYAAEFDLSSARFDPDHSQDYGEERWNAIGFLHGRLFVLTFSLLNDDLMRVISLRKATPEERTRYAEE